MRTIMPCLFILLNTSFTEPTSTPLNYRVRYLVLHFISYISLFSQYKWYFTSDLLSLLQLILKAQCNCTTVQNQKQCGSIKLPFELKFLINKTPPQDSPGPIQFSFIQQDTTSAVLCCVQTVTVRSSYDSRVKCLCNGKRCYSPPPHTHT